MKQGSGIGYDQSRPFSMTFMAGVHVIFPLAECLPPVGEPSPPVDHIGWPEDNPSIFGWLEPVRHAVRCYQSAFMAFKRDRSSRKSQSCVTWEVQATANQCPSGLKAT